jgi:hypothetical protein
MEFEATVELSNALSASDAQILRRLNEDLSGNCYKGAFIEEVTEIRKRSAAYVIKTNTSGSCYIDVRFYAKVTVFNKWDVITGVVILSNQQILTGKYNNKAAVTLLPGKGIELIAVGYIVPVRISLARHIPMNKATIVGTIFAAEKIAPKYSVFGMVEKTPIIEYLYGEIITELELRKALEPAKVEFFEDLLTATVPETTTVPVTTFSITTVAKAIIGGKPFEMTGIWYRPIGVRRSSDTFVSVVGDNKDTIAVFDDVVISKPNTVFEDFIKSMHDYLKAIREMCEQYDDLKKYELLWRYMRENKK